MQPLGCFANQMVDLKFTNVNYFPLRFGNVFCCRYNGVAEHAQTALELQGGGIPEYRFIRSGQIMG